MSISLLFLNDPGDGPCGNILISGAVESCVLYIQFIFSLATCLWSPNVFLASISMFRVVTGVGCSSRWCSRGLAIGWWFHFICGKGLGLCLVWLEGGGILCPLGPGVSLCGRGSSVDQG